MIKDQIIVLDDLIPKNLQDEIENVLTGPEFPWYMTCHKNKDGEFITSDYSQNKKFDNNNNVKDIGQLVHIFMKIGNDERLGDNITIRSPYFDFILSVLELATKKYDLKNVLVKRIKSNLKTTSQKFNKDSFGTPHRDYDKSHFVLIYYVNDSDGDTFIFDNEDDLNITKRITPKKGRVLLFDGKYYHAAGNPVDSNYRIVVNYDFTIDE